MLEFWFAEDNESSVKAAALNYLSDLGQPSDLEAIQIEYARNETQTASAAINAMLKINLRDDRRAAFKLLHDLQPSNLADDVLQGLFLNDVEFSDEQLAEELKHRSDEVRRTVAEILIQRKTLTLDQADLLLADSTASIRLQAIHFLLSRGRVFSLSEAKAALVRPVSGNLFGLSSGSDADGEAAFEKFRQVFLMTAPTAQLTADAEVEFYHQSSYIALVQKHYKKRKLEFCDAIKDKFVSRLNTSIDLMVARVGASELFDPGSFKSYPCSKFRREALDVVCEKMDASDLNFVRACMAEPDLPYSSKDLAYLSKYGQWPDITLIVNSLNRRSKETGTSLLNRSLENSNKYKAAAEAILKLGKHRISDLLTMNMPDALLSRLISAIPDRSFSLLANSQIKPLFQSDNDNVRKRAAIKCGRSLSQNRLKLLLQEYSSAETYFYNVVHWLDFGVSCPHKAVVRQALKFSLGS